MSEKVYLNGELLDSAKASVSVWNPSFLQGVGLFETLRTYGGRPFRLDIHIDRLTMSATHFKMPIAEVTGLIPEAVRTVLDANRLSDARIRITVTPPAPTDPDARPVLLVTAQAVAGYAPELHEKGMTVLLCTDYRQSSLDPLTGHKTTSYFPRLAALRVAHERGCGESLWFTPQNQLAEGCISNVFLVKGGRLRTPPLETPVLPGITRNAVLRLAAEAGIDAGEASCTVDDLLDADEVFLTNAIMEVMPVTHIERKPIGNEKPGAITVQLLGAYRKAAQRE